MRGYLFFTALLFVLFLPQIVNAQGGYFAPGSCPGGYCYYPSGQQSYQPTFSQYGVPNHYGAGCQGNYGFQPPQYSFSPQFQYQPPIFNAYQLPPPIILEEPGFPRFRHRGFQLDLRLSRERQFAFR